MIRKIRMIGSRSGATYFVFGFCCASVLFFVQDSFISESKRSVVINMPMRETVQKIFDNDGADEKRHVLHDPDHDDDHAQNQGMFVHTHEENAVAQSLKESVKVFCWIMAAKKNADKAKTVNATWAPRCNKYVFITANESAGVPTVELDVQEGREYLWAKTKAAFTWLYENEIDNYDWFLKADDDTYVIMENLRFMLLAYSPDDPLYFGCKFKPFTKQGYMSGGSGYVLSREAVKRFVTEAIPNPQKCKQRGTGAEDAEIGKCLEKVGVIAGDSRDSEGRHRMLPFSPLTHLQAGGNKTVPDWFHKYMYYPYVQGRECCSDYMISFHYVNKGTMYALDNLLYHIRPIGFFDELWNNALQENDGKSIIETLKDLALKTSQPVTQKDEDEEEAEHDEKRDEEKVQEKIAEKAEENPEENPEEKVQEPNSNK